MQDIKKAGRVLKVFLAVFICRILYFFGAKVGRGSSLPGKIVLKIFPDVLLRLKLPETIIAVTGSNGKTSTAELIKHVLEASGKSVGWNHEGSNQTEGVATLLLRVSDFRGVVKRDAIVMECDERYTKKIFENVKPSVLLVTNLCRDQLTRNGHPEFIEDCIRAAIDVVETGSGNRKTKLVLNADDPYVTALAVRQGASVGVAFCDTYTGPLSYGLNPASGTSARTGMYDDGAFCPVCKERMEYSYRITGHYGSYKCTSCGLKRSDPDVEATLHKTAAVFYLTFNENNDNKLKTVLPSVTGAYNFCAAVAAVNAAGININDAINALDGYELKSGRVTTLSWDKPVGLLLLSKHENSLAYNCSLSWIVEQQKPCTVIVLVDSISRKYYTSETSWFWDIDFDLLTDNNVKRIVLSGRYVNELAARFAMSAVDNSKIEYIADPDDLGEYLKRSGKGEIYAVTCFSDKAKLLKAFDG